jgi:ligand-binding sensor domain-containing protein/tRNA A-37 threonylcarbamoyl transferase component Bud32
MRITGRAGCLAGLMLVLAGGPALALDPTRALTQYLHDNWQTEQGLPQNTVQAICQTRDGYLWFGTQEGLVRFDGVRFTVFDKRNTPALVNHFVLALHEDPQGNLWIGVRGGGLVRLRDGAFTLLRDGLPTFAVRAIYGDRAGNVWVGTSGGGLLRLRDGQLTTFTTKDGLSHDQVVALTEDRAGNLWVGTFGGGLNRFRDGKFTAFTTRDGLSDDQISALLEDRAGNLWVGTFNRGVNRFRDGVFTPFTTREGLSSDQVWSMLEDSDGNLWVGTDGGGLNRFHGGRFMALTTREGLPSDVVFSIFEDRERNLWIGTDLGGLNRLRDGKFLTLTTREGLSSDMVFSILEDRQGNMWMATEGGGLNRLTNGRVSAFTTKDGLSSDHLVSLAEDRAGNLWIGTRGGGLNRLRDGRFTAYTTKDGLSYDVVNSIFEDRAANLWIGTDGGGLNRMSNGRFSTYTMKEGLSQDRVVAIHEDRQGGLWLGTSGGGLDLFKDGRFTVYNTQTGLQHNHVTSLHEDAEGTLWVGTSGGGLHRYRNGVFTAYTTKHGLHDDRIFRILEDAQGDLWMSSNRGVFRVRKQELDDFAQGKRAQISSTVFGAADGMRSAECNGEAQPAGWKARDGRLWFPTIKGVVVIDPARIPRNLLPPPVVLEETRVDGQFSTGGSASSALEVPPGSDTLDFQYTALSLVYPQHVRFKYRLEGFDRDWVDAGTARAAHYTNLPPGRYTFRVKACNNDGVWNEEGASLALNLQPFFYQTRTFQVLCGLALVLLGGLAQELRGRAVKRRAQELERIVKEQTHHLSEANRDLRQAQEQLARLSETSPEKLENVAAWGTSMAAEIGRAIQADGVQLWRADGDTLTPLTPGASRPPRFEDLQAARAHEIGGADGVTLVPVTGMTNELRGALVIQGHVRWGDTERRLVTGLAQHLGSALDLQHMREQLTLTAARQAEVRQRMLERGVHTLKLCPRCGSCYAQEMEVCAKDGATLDGSRLLPYRVLERYRLTTLLGEGGMGSVFAAKDEKLEREVALKVIRAEKLSDPEARFRLDREARALARVSHPSVIGLFDSGELEDGSAFLVMELLSGRDLADVLLRHGRGSPPQVATLLRQVGSGLAAAHRAGVIHRDVKPANIFVISGRDTLQSKVLDFGLAREVRAEAGLTQAGVLMGTPAYMSPEQVEGADLDVRTDVYSLAAVMYEALGGRPVIEGQEAGRMLVDVLYATPPPLSTLRARLPAGVDALFAAALAKHPAERPADIEAWAGALAALLETVEDGDGWPADLRA